MPLSLMGLAGWLPIGRAHSRCSSHTGISRPRRLGCHRGAASAHAARRQRDFLEPGNGRPLDRYSIAAQNLAALPEAPGLALPRAVFRVYSKWIDGADKSREREKLNIGFGHDLATELIAEAKKFAQSNAYLAETQSLETRGVALF